MATIEQIAALRLLIDESDESTYSDAALGARINVQPDLDVLAYDIWIEKAAAYAKLVDVSEGGSSRSMGDLQSQALKMAESFRQRATAPTTPPGGEAGVRLRRISRP